MKRAKAGEVTVAIQEDFMRKTPMKRAKAGAQDYAEAVRWYRKAGGQGEAVAQILLGSIYEDGQGVAQDYVQAHMWYNLAAAQGQKKARKWRDNLAEKMTPAQIAEAEKLAREWKPKGK